MQVRKAPKFVTLKGAETNTERETIDLLYEADDGSHVAIELDPFVIPASITAMSINLNQLAEIRPNLPSQSLNVQGMDLVMAGNGDVAIQLQFEGKLKLSLHFPPEQVGSLVSILDDLRELVSRRPQ